MLGLSILFFLLAIGAGVMGFSGAAGALTTVAVIAFYVFLALMIVSLVVQMFRGANGQGGAVGVLVMALIAFGGFYIWSQNHPGTWRQDLHAITADASDVVKKSDQKAKQVVGDVSQDTREAIDENKAKNSQ